MIKANSHLTKILSLIGITSTALYFNSENAQALPNFYLPYPNGSTYQVTQGWGGSVSHTDYYNKYAVDFGMSIGQPVAATAPGKVIRSSRGKSGIAGGCDRRYINSANYVVIDHGDNVSSLYLHLSEVNVSVGDTISKGQIIGKSGNTGYVCGSHLHFTFQKTNTVGTYAGESIQYGFIETGKNAPQSGVSYTSQNSTNYTSQSSVLPSIATIVSKATGKALDAGGANGNQIYPHPKPDNSNPFHRWRLEKAGDFYLIISVATGKALDAGGANGNEIYPHPKPDPSNGFHLWKLQKIGDFYLITNKATGKALDAGGANGNQIYPHHKPDPSNDFHLWRIN